MCSLTFICFQIASQRCSTSIISQELSLSTLSSCLGIALFSCMASPMAWLTVLTHFILGSVCLFKFARSLKISCVLCLLNWAYIPHPSLTAVFIKRSYSCSTREWSLVQWLQVLILCGEDVGLNPAGKLFTPQKLSIHIPNPLLPPSLRRRRGRLPSEILQTFP
jgi:hypothetical protein